MPPILPRMKKPATRAQANGQFLTVAARRKLLEWRLLHIHRISSRVDARLGGRPFPASDQHHHYYDRKMSNGRLYSWAANPASISRFDCSRLSIESHTLN